MTITSGVLDEHGKCIVPRSRHRDGGGSSNDPRRQALLTNEQADQVQYDAMMGPSPGGGQVGQDQMPMTQTTTIHDHSGWTGQMLNVLQEHQPWDLSGRAAKMWNMLKGQGQKGGGGRNEWTMFATPGLSQHPVEIEHPQEVAENASGQAHALQERKTQDPSGRVGKMRSVMPGHEQ
jgi:hypothetical protein